MKTTFKRYMFLSLLAAGAVQAEPASEYWDTAFGWNPYRMNSAEKPGSLMHGMRAERQLTRRYAGVPTQPDIMRQAVRHAENGIGLKVGSWVLLPSSPQKFMPYLDGIFVPGNTCCEPCTIVGEDVVSTTAQKVKHALSRVGLQYTLTLSADYAGIAPRPAGRRANFMSFNNAVSGNWFLAKSADGGQGVFLSFEADWGQGANFNERRNGVQQSLGSLSDPQGCLRGGNGVFLPQLALGYSGFDGKWVMMAGTLDSSNFLDQNAYSADWNGNLMNQSFNYNPCLPLEWANWGYLSAWQPCEHFYAMYATTGCNGRVNHNPFSTISSNAWVHVGEFGIITEDFMGLGAGTYRFQYTLTRNEGKTGSGAALNFQQQLGPKSQLGFFTRCGLMDEDAATVNDVRACATAGLVLQAPFRTRGWGSRSNNDQLAFGFLWVRAAVSAKPYEHKDEYGLELSAVVQMTPTFFLQPDVQYIFNPIHDDGSGAFVLQVQGVYRF